MDFNKNKGFIITLVIGVILTLVLLIMWRGAEGTYDSTRGDTESAQSSYQSLVKKYDGAPTKEMIAIKEEQTDALLKKAQEMRTSVPNTQLPSYSPTTFKKDLRTARDTYQDAAAAQNLRIVEDIGFAEYLGAKVPEQSDLPKLTRQFVLVQSVMDVLFSNNVEEISTIDRNISEDASAGGGIGFMDEDIVFDDSAGERGSDATAKTSEDTALYDAVPVSFQFRIKPGNLYAVLAGIRNAQYFLRVRDIETRLEVMSTGTAVDPADIYEMLTVECVIDHIKFTQKNTQ